MTDRLLADLLERYAEELPEEPAWNDVLRRARWARGRAVAVAAVVAAVVVVPSALAFSAVRHAFYGAHPPASVVRGFAGQHAGRGRPPTVIPMGMKLRPVDPSSTHGVLAARSLDGPLYLWAADEAGSGDEGGECWFATWARDLRRPWTVATAAGCDQPSQQRGITYSYSWQVPHWSVAVLVGRVYPNAATVAVSYGCGQTRVLPVVEHLFMTAFVWSTRVVSITARDQSGRVVAMRRVPWRPSPGGPTAPNSALHC